MVILPVRSSPIRAVFKNVCALLPRFCGRFVGKKKMAMLVGKMQMFFHEARCDCAGSGRERGRQRVPSSSREPIKNNERKNKASGDRSSGLQSQILSLYRGLSLGRAVY